jgi:hypothetical protein
MQRPNPLLFCLIVFKIIILYLFYFYFAQASKKWKGMAGSTKMFNYVNKFFAPLCALAAGKAIIDIVKIWVN